MLVLAGGWRFVSDWASQQHVVGCCRSSQWQDQLQSGVSSWDCGGSTTVCSTSPHRTQAVSSHQRSAEFLNHELSGNQRQPRLLRSTRWPDSGFGILPYLTLLSGWVGCDTCPALRPYHSGPMRIPECNHKVMGNGYETVDGCEAVNKWPWSCRWLWSWNQHYNRRVSSTLSLVKGTVTVLIELVVTLLIFSLGF